jgi:hypothetical protein
MFQYAYGIYLAQKNNTKLYLDTRFYNHQNHRRFLLNQFQNIEIDDGLDMIQNNYPIYTITDNFSYKEIPNPVDCNYYLDGYWQSQKYFNNIREEIIKYFTPNDDVLNKLKETEFIETNTTSLHVRRTDYVTSNGYHPVQDISYYVNAIKEIGDYDYLFVFSDDIKWCKDNLKFNNIIYTEGMSEIEDMMLMSMCKNNIIANSTFSWWAAYLNQNPNKKIVAPKKWFGDHVNIDTKDIIPEEWIKI